MPEEARAWHAGAGVWGGAEDVNSRSIGIELANAGPLDGFPPFPEPQMAALEGLLDAICARWGIPPAGVIAHSDMAPGRKADPGPKFDWRRLARGGRAVWAEAARTAEPADWESFRGGGGGGRLRRRRRPEAVLGGGAAAVPALGARAPLAGCGRCGCFERSLTRLALTGGRFPR